MHRPKWHRTYRFADGGVFKFWNLNALDKEDPTMRRHLTFREKVGFWTDDRSQEPPWDIQERICFMVKNNEKNEDLARMDDGTMHVSAAVAPWVLWWVALHPNESCLDPDVWDSVEDLVVMLEYAAAEQQKEQYGRIQKANRR